MNRLLYFRRGRTARRTYLVFAALLGTATGVLADSPLVRLLALHESSEVEIFFRFPIGFGVDSSGDTVVERLRITDELVLADGRCTGVPETAQLLEVQLDLNLPVHAVGHSLKHFQDRQGGTRTVNYGNWDSTSEAIPAGHGTAVGVPLVNFDPGSALTDINQLCVSKVTMMFDTDGDSDIDLRGEIPRGKTPNGLFYPGFTGNFHIDYNGTLIPIPVACAPSPACQ